MNRFSHILLAAICWAAATTPAGAVPAQPATGDQLVILERPDARVKADDAEALQRLLTAAGKRGWFATVYDKQRYQPPATRGATVYLRPNVDTARLRRGDLVFFQTPNAADAPAAWQEETRWVGGQHYAQLPPPGRPFVDPLEPGADLGAFFAVQGKVSDSDLLAVAKRLRAAAKATGKRHADHAAHVRGDYRINQVRSTAAGNLEVATSDGGSRGQNIGLRKRRGRWHITRVEEFEA